MTNEKTNASTFTNRINGAAGSMTISITASTTGLFEDRDVYDTLAIDDRLNWNWTVGAGAGENLRAGCLGLQVTTPHGKIPYVTGRASFTTSVAAGDTEYDSFTASTSGRTTESEASCKAPMNFSIANLAVRIDTNGVTAASSITFRKNNANGNLTVSIASETTGDFQDLINTDDIANGDEINWILVAGATGTSFEYQQIGCVGSPNWTWGQQYADGETPPSWAEWSNGAGGSPTIVGDANWGSINLESAAIGHSDVRDTGNVNPKTITVTMNKYGVGAGTMTPWIRGQATTFTQDAGSPSWEEYTAPVARTWRYIQLRLVGD
jgi:hypothetical protein